MLWTSRLRRLHSIIVPLLAAQSNSCSEPDPKAQHGRMVEIGASGQFCDPCLMLVLELVLDSGACGSAFLPRQYSATRGGQGSRKGSHVAGSYARTARVAVALSESLKSPTGRRTLEKVPCSGRRLWGTADAMTPPHVRGFHAGGGQSCVLSATHRHRHDSHHGHNQSTTLDYIKSGKCHGRTA